MNNNSPEELKLLLINYKADPKEEILNKILSHDLVQKKINYISAKYANGNISFKDNKSRLKTIIWENISKYDSKYEVLQFLKLIEIEFKHDFNKLKNLLKNLQQYQKKLKKPMAEK